MFPIIGYPFGPGGYGRRLEVHFLLIRAKAIIIAATAKAGRVRPSDTNMVDGDRQWVETLRRRPRDQVLITSEFSALCGEQRPRPSSKLCNQSDELEVSELQLEPPSAKHDSLSAWYLLISLAHDPGV